MTEIQRRSSSGSSATTTASSAIRIERSGASSTGRQRGDPKGLAAPVDLDLEDGFFGREVAVEGSYRDARRGRDLLHGDGVEASLGEELEGNGLQLSGHHARSHADHLDARHAARSDANDGPFD